MNKDIPMSYTNSKRIRTISHLANVIIDDNNFKEFEDLVQYARHHDGALLGLIMERTYFFTKYLDSRRYNPKNSSDTLENKTKN